MSNIKFYLTNGYFIKKEIIAVAKHFEDREAFKEQAKISAKKLGYTSIELLTKYFHNCPKEPKELKKLTSKYGILGVWMDICQNSIFEIIYNFKEKSLNKLFSIGFGEYDWTQYKAIDILCRLASEDIKRDEILNEIETHLDDFRWNTYISTMESLVLIQNEKVDKIFQKEINKIVKDEDFDDAIEIIDILFSNNLQTKSKYKNLLKDIILENNEAFNIRYNNVNHNENIRIQALLTFVKDENRDLEIWKKLKEWKKTTSNKNLLDKIEEIEKTTGNKV